jgi:RNA recognition motif-containing protein
VSNLNWKTSWQDLKDKFRESGEVVYANVVRDDDGELQPFCIETW